MVMVMVMVMLMMMVMMMIIDDVSTHLEDLENPDCRAVARERQQSWKKVGDVIAGVFIDDGHCVSGHIVHILESALFVNFLLMGWPKDGVACSRRGGTASHARRAVTHSPIPDSVFCPR